MTIKAPRYQADQLPDLRAELVRLYGRHVHDHTMVAVLLVAMGLLDMAEAMAVELAALRGVAQDYAV